MAASKSKKGANKKRNDVKKVEDVQVLDPDDPERAGWGGQLEFILTCIGFAVGLGNVWRFPYLTYENGGGAFLIPYLLMLFFVGLPLFYLETSFGQFASLGPITAYAYSPALKGVGIAGIVVAAYICIYYNVIVAWCLFYFFASMNTDLPWEDCDNWWNSDCCLAPGAPLNTTANCPNGTAISTAAEEYYYDYVLQITEGIDDSGVLRWQLVLCLMMSWVIIFLVLLKGIASLGKASYFVSLFPYVLLTIMLIRGVTLPGASKGIEYYLTPDWSRLTEAKVWADAATQIFYSLGISMGGLIAMASFNKFDNNIMRDALIIPFVNCGTSIYAGFVIFSVLGYMAEEKGVEVDEVAAEGPGLVFVVYPEGLSTMPGAPIWAVLFFFMMTTLGFSSQFSTAEGVVSAFIDEFPALGIDNRPMMCRILLCVSFFLLGLPMVTQGGFYLFNIMDIYSAGYTLLIVAFFELVGIMYVYGYMTYGEDLAMMLGKKPGPFWEITWRYVSPTAIFVVFISKCVQQTPLTFEDYVYPQWANGLGWCIVAFPVVVMAGVFLYTYCAGGGYKVLKDVTSPTSRWGPARAKDRTGRYAMPKEDTDKVALDLPHYWHAVKQWSSTGSHVESGPPSYANGANGNGSGGAVRSVTEQVPMQSYDISGNAAAAASHADAVVMRSEQHVTSRHDMSKKTAAPAAPAAFDVQSTSNKSSTPNEKSSPRSTQEVYAQINRTSRTDLSGVYAQINRSSHTDMNGVDNSAFVHDDHRGSQASRDSSVEGAPVAVYSNAAEATTVL